eukprot:PhF_6_TR6161/c0_g1_i2/m.9180
MIVSSTNASPMRRIESPPPEMISQRQSSLQHPLFRTLNTYEPYSLQRTAAITLQEQLESLQHENSTLRSQCEILTNDMDKYRIQLTGVVRDCEVTKKENAYLLDSLAKTAAEQKRLHQNHEDLRLRYLRSQEELLAIRSLWHLQTVTVPMVSLAPTVHQHNMYGAKLKSIGTITMDSDVSRIMEEEPTKTTIVSNVGVNTSPMGIHSVNGWKEQSTQASMPDTNPMHSILEDRYEKEFQRLQQKHNSEVRGFQSHYIDLHNQIAHLYDMVRPWVSFLHDALWWRYTQIETTFFDTPLSQCCESLLCPFHGITKVNPTTSGALVRSLSPPRVSISPHHHLLR